MVQWSLWVLTLLKLHSTDCNNVFLNILLIHEYYHLIACYWRHREESGGTVLTMLNIDTTPRQFNPRERDVAPTVQQAGRNREQVWREKYFLPPTGVRTPNSPVRKAPQYLLRYPHPQPHKK